MLVINIYLLFHSHLPISLYVRLDAIIADSILLMTVNEEFSNLFVMSASSENTGIYHSSRDEILYFILVEITC
jgi:hypothetical protein